MQQQDTGKFRTNTKDQFYTKDLIARMCIETIIQLVPSCGDCIWLEPSAGAGAFLKQFPAEVEVLGLDLDPKAPGILQKDYLSWTPEHGKQYLVVGNPPFGRQSSLAKAFIKKSCEFASAIAFILPKSFTKPSMSNAFHPHFHCIHSFELAANSFVLNNTSYDVPCVFQIWVKQAQPRAAVQKIDPLGFTYAKNTDLYDLAVRRVGGLAGKTYLRDGTDYSIQSHYFLLLEPRYKPHVHAIQTKMNAHVFPSNTVGPRSLSKSEINEVLNRILQSVSC